MKMMMAFSSLCSILSPLQHWSEAEKNLAIDELIEKCDPSQVRHIMSVIEPQFQRDFISLLPKEVREPVSVSTSLPSHPPPTPNVN